MTALPLQRPRLLTVAGFAALPEATEGRYELQEVHVVMSPRPVPEHQRCSRRTGHSITHDEYADAGIPHYWIVDIDDRPGRTACHHAGEFGYADAPPTHGVLMAEEFFPVRLDRLA